MVNIERAACVVLGIACVVLGVWGFLLTGQRDLARQDAAAWGESAAKNRAALEDMTAAHARLRQALAEREETLAALERERERQRVKLREAMRNDKAVSDWGGVSVPSAVDGLLR